MKLVFTFQSNENSLFILPHILWKSNVSTYICLLAEDEKNLFLIMHISDNYVHSFFFSIPSLKKQLQIAIRLKVLC